MLVGGVNSPVRSFREVECEPIHAARAFGSRIVDILGREFIDYIGSWGSAILGHADPATTESIQRASRDGASFGLTNEYEIWLAETIVQRVPSVEKVRFTNSGTEAVMTAIRLAKAVTNRTCVIKFSGGYHGHSTATMNEQNSTSKTLNGTLLEVPFNDLNSVAEAFRQRAASIAAVIVEPVSGNMGVIPPVEGFLAGLRELCDRHGSLLIFDEVMTGFRVAYGGAQDRYRVPADLTTFGKIIGGGLPVGAVGGRANLMNWLAPIGKVYHGGTFAGNPVTMAAGLATLEQLTAESYLQLESATGRLAEGIRIAAQQTDFAIQVQQVGSMISMFFAENPVENFYEATQSDLPMFVRFYSAMLDRGILLPPSPLESWFVSLQHHPTDIATTLSAITGSFSVIQRNRLSPLRRAAAR